MQFRPEIDGLRAFAVGSVILFHADLTIAGAALLPGGSYGVDVFFVISGYLISRLMFEEEAATGSVNIGAYYQRRIRRIVPALLAVVLACVPVAYLISNAGDAADFRNSAIAALLSVSNVYFLWSTTAYDATASQLLPMLHTWSLGIEEQFYLLFPAFVWLTAGRAARHRGGMLAFAFTASLICCVWLAGRDQASAFFLPFTRFWELLAGILVAHAERRRPVGAMSLGLSQVLDQKVVWPLSALLGLLLVVGSFFLPVSAGLHPGIITLVPVAGAALVCAAAAQGDPAGRILGWAPFLWVGKVSYSAYLWHFPLFAFARQLLGEPSVTVKLVLIGATFGLAKLSYDWLERPLRDPRRFSFGRVGQGIVLVSALLAGSVFAMASLAPEKGSRLLADVSGAMTASFDVQGMSAAAQDLSLRQTAFDEAALHKVLVVGNSHSRSLTNAFVQSPDAWAGTSFVRAPMQISCFDPDVAENVSIARAFFAADSYLNADTIIVATRYRHKQTCPTGPNSPDWIDDKKGLAALLSRVAVDGKSAVVVGPSVETKGRKGAIMVYEPIRTLLLTGRRAKLEADAGFSAEIATRINRSAYAALLPQTALAASVKDIATRAGAEYIDLYPLLCDDAAKICHAMTDRNERAFSDTNHLTVAGSAFLGRRLVDAGLPLTLRADLVR